MAASGLIDYAMACGWALARAPPNWATRPPSAATWAAATPSIRRWPRSPSLTPIRPSVITDLFQGGNQARLVRRLGEMVESGVRAICLLALSDTGVPSYDESLARKLVAMGISCFGCTLQRLPDLLEGALRGRICRRWRRMSRRHSRRT
jgi:VWA domain containing CoxE-like protein